MLDNNTYNLMMQLVEESQSVWRIKTNYEQEAGSCDECLDFWKQLLVQKERNIDELEKLMKKHFQ